MEGKFAFVAEDDMFAQNVVKMILKTLKVDCTVHVDGNEVFEAWKNKQGQCSIVLMDIHMPNCDGYEAAKKMRNYEKEKGWKQTKIYALSGDDDSETKAQVVSSGMNGLLKKPLNPGQLATLL
ncbi:CheY-like superfamily [Pseudocohnilembus persalinus]|uniref:CheY-like superfamily n=1 Tax=Pseudocohnilembus persalinus TaxID=266149 RepID=A0A0V0QD76_PSEPJ|nr:CheY-like superfamily [Pseudocohnilembus persalinus]|eukprot:KRX00163.1 CheY-like superfamily [Pseudocohnilembus persalinus]